VAQIAESTKASAGEFHATASFEQLGKRRAIRNRTASPSRADSSRINEVGFLRCSFFDFAQQGQDCFTLKSGQKRIGKIRIFLHSSCTIVQVID
jgi:hypothetical protein